MDGEIRICLSLSIGITRSDGLLITTIWWKASSVLGRVVHLYPRTQQRRQIRSGENEVMRSMLCHGTFFVCVMDF